MAVRPVNKDSRPWVIRGTYNGRVIESGFNNAADANKRIREIIREAIATPGNRLTAAQIRTAFKATSA